MVVAVGEELSVGTNGTFGPAAQTFLPHAAYGAVPSVDNETGHVTFEEYFGSTTADGSSTQW